MLKDITLGQYFPGTTFIHRLDPRTKLLLTILYIVLLFVAKSYFSYALVLVWLVSIIIISKIKLSALFKGLKPVIIILVFTAVLNLFYGEGKVLVHFWKLQITDGGIRTACFMAVRVIMLLMGTFLLTYTTSPMDLTDGLERLLSPLKKIKFPVHELAMMMSIALRFIPTLIEETDKIMSAQKARGADFETGGLFKKAKALVPVLVPLFVSAFRRADELATAMESRCYNGGRGRTKLKVLHFKGGDIFAFCAAAVMLAGVIVLVNFGL